MKRYTHVIWDFNGTVYNDVDACIRSANRLLTAHGLMPFSTVTEYRERFGFPIIDYYRRMGFDFDVTPYDELAVEWVDYYMEETRSAHLYDGFLPAWEFFRDNGLVQILLSATEREMLSGQLELLGVRGCFDEILGQDTIHAYGKRELGVAWSAAHPDAVPILIGDTEHDAEVARAMGADCILLACGHRPSAALKQCGALAVAEDHPSLLCLFFREC